jgi:uncharacterized protein with von Willebrand factor type A (vWA) domain
VHNYVRPAYDQVDVESRTVGVVVGLTRKLRAFGLPVSTVETLDAVRALAAVGVGQRSLVRSALAATLVKDRTHDATFARLFDAAFPYLAPQLDSADQTPPRPADPSESDRPSGDLHESLADALRRGDDADVTVLLDGAVQQWGGLDGPLGTERHHVQRVLRGVGLDSLLRQLTSGDTDRSDLERRLGRVEANELIDEVRRLLEQLVACRLTDLNPDSAVQSPENRPDLQDREILRAGPAEISALRVAVRPLARLLASRLGRRQLRGRGRLDMRRTMRRSMASGGVPLDPQLRRRSPSKPDLVVLCDVSGSVAQYSPFVLALLHALHGEFGHVRSWTFVDGIVEITDLLESADGILDPHRLLARRGLVAVDGRSDYGRAFDAFLAGWPDVVTGKSTVLVVGDARSHDRSPALTQTAELARLSRRLYWLNPEPHREWDIGDSVMSSYGLHCTRTFEVSTLRQLADCVAALV